MCPVPELPARCGAGARIRLDDILCDVRRFCSTAAAIGAQRVLSRRSFCRVGTVLSYFGLLGRLGNAQLINNS